MRAACGPLAPALWRAGFDPNALAVYATAFGAAWPAWLLAVALTPLRRLPPAVHAVFGCLWCFGGVCLTAAI